MDILFQTSPCINPKTVSSSQGQAWCSTLRPYISETVQTAHHTYIQLLEAVNVGIIEQKQFLTVFASMWMFIFNVLRELVKSILDAIEADQKLDSDKIDREMEFDESNIDLDDMHEDGEGESILTKQSKVQ